MMNLLNRGVVVLTFLICLILTSVCSAKISTDKDAFDGSVTIRSSYEHREGNIFGVDKYRYVILRAYSPSDKQTVNQISISKSFVGKASQSKLIPVYDVKADIKIDNDIYQIVLIDSRIDDISSNYPNLVGWYEIPEPMLYFINKAKKVTLRYRWSFPGGSLDTVIFELPPEVLKEWQEVASKKLP